MVHDLPLSVSNRVHIGEAWALTIGLQNSVVRTRSRLSVIVQHLASMVTADDATSVTAVVI